MIVKLILTLLLGVVLLYAFAEYRRTPLLGFLIAAASLGGAYLVWMPSQATRLAEFAGVGRGVDLILYLWVGISLIILLNLHLKLRAQHEIVTELARAIALAEARCNGPSASERQGLAGTL